MQDIIEFILLTNKLKEIKRSGWIKRKIKDPESVADHTFGIVLLTYLLAKENKLNETKCLKLALVHDLGESIIGDIITYNKDSKFKKTKLNNEKKAINKLSKLSNKKEISLLWKELNANKTKESKFVNQIDKLAAFIQSYVYSKKGHSDYLAFKKDVDKIATYKNIKNIIKAIDKER